MQKMTTVKIDEVLVNPIFIAKVKEGVKKLILERSKRPAPKPGFRYKKDWYDRMSPGNKVNSVYFLEHIDDIWTKVSNLNSEERRIITLVCDRAISETVNAPKK
jgi:hypothetical protein